MNKGEISKYVDELPANGRYTFTRRELRREFSASDAAIKLSLNRLQKKGKVVSPHRGFYVVVPEQYRLTGAPPPVWFIDALMKDWQSGYYVGLLSAAEVYGAAHQHPQEFQVVCDRAHRTIEISRYRIRFFKKWNIDETPVIEKKTPTGVMKVSTPEATALDLVRYYQDAGYFSNVLTVISELAEAMQGQRLVAAAKCNVELAVIQRLGFLLDLAGKDKLADALNVLVSKRSPRASALRTDLEQENSQLNRRWMLFINEQLEADQ